MCLNVNAMYELKFLYKEATTLQKVRKKSITCNFIFLVWWPIKEILFLSKGKGFWPLLSILDKKF